MAWQVWNRVRYIFAKSNEKNNKQATFALLSLINSLLSTLSALGYETKQRVITRLSERT